MQDIRVGVGFDMLRACHGQCMKAFEGIEAWCVLVIDWMKDGTDEASPEQLERATEKLEHLGLADWARTFGFGPVLKSALEHGWATECSRCGGDLGDGSRGEWSGSGTMRWLCAGCVEAEDDE